MVEVHPVDAADQRRVRRFTVTPEHPHGDQFDAFSDPVGSAAQRARDVRAVTVTVGVTATVVNRRDASGKAVAELAPAANPGIDHIGGHAAPGRFVVIAAVEGQVPLIDAVETPARTLLQVRVCLSL